MHFSYNNNIIKIDCGPYYYAGSATKDRFPKELKDNYEDIINKSFDNYEDEYYSITHSFDEKNSSIYSIHFNYFKEPIKMEHTIVIFMTHYLKDYKDYTNDRFEKLENLVDKLENTIEKLEETIYKLRTDNENLLQSINLLKTMNQNYEGTINNLKDENKLLHKMLNKNQNYELIIKKLMEENKQLKENSLLATGEKIINESVESLKNTINFLS